jgi:MFS transporter, OFA family, oxalate/formate antiporter
MTVMLGLQAVTLLLLLTFGGNPALFVIFSGLGFFSYGEIFSLFPAMSADMFGRQYATTNYGLLYTSKGVASLLVPVGGAIRAATGSWVPMFAVAIALNALASLACATILPRTARAHVDQASLEGAGQPAFAPAQAVAGGSE